MPTHSWLLCALLLLAPAVTAQESPATESKNDGLSALAGTWLYVEDQTKDRPVEKHQPPMSWLFGFRIEKDRVVMLRGKRQREEPILINGKAIEEKRQGSTTSRSGSWKDGVLTYTVKTVRDEDQKVSMLIQREFSVTKDGLKVRVLFGSPPTSDQLALYKHPDDIELPTPAKASLEDMAWLAGDWTGTRGKSSIEERWSPPLGGVMLATSRTVSGNRLRAFEYLRIAQRKDTLVYVAQPNGRTATEFTLIKLTKNEAAFANPRHDFPQRITYTRNGDALTATIGFMNGGTPRKFEFRSEMK